MHEDVGSTMTKGERVVVFVLLGAMAASIFLVPALRPDASPAVQAILLSSMLLMSLAALLLEHFLSKPSDVIAASVSILLLLIPSRELLRAWGFWYWIAVGLAGAVLSAALLALVLVTDRRSENSLQNRIARLLKEFAVGLGSGKKQYFMLFLFTALFFLDPVSPGFLAVMIYAAFVLAVEPQTMTFRIHRGQKPRREEIGEILSVRGRNTFLVRLHDRNRRPPIRSSDLLEFSYGMDEPPRIRTGVILERYYLDQAQWITVLCLDAPEADVQAEPAGRRTDAVYRRDGDAVARMLETLVGVVIDDSNISAIRFLHAGRAEVEEGSLVEVRPKGRRVLYQVVNAKVDLEALESRNQADLVVGEAVQLGVWVPDGRRFERFGWVPEAYTPIHTCTDVESPPLAPSEMVLGQIPGSNHRVVLNKTDAVSHHTAILGVTGAGKSVFARHLVYELLDDPDLRVIVVDFTREWTEKLPAENMRRVIAEEEEDELFKAVNRLAKEKAEFKNNRDTAVIAEAVETLKNGFEGAITDLIQGDQQLGVFELPDVSNVEGVLEYTQTFFWSLFNMAKRGELENRRICIVLEEAHTVIPEWNFIGLADKSSQALVNNLSQIALQGRKYQIGFIVIAQRTANVSKTVLTQCNTVIAFQCFDDTSLKFLGNYLPKQVTAAIPGLKFRNAIAVGKAISGSVPLMFEVPVFEDA